VLFKRRETPENANNEGEKMISTSFMVFLPTKIASTADVHEVTKTLSSTKQDDNNNNKSIFFHAMQKQP
jgi:hypothetical protein